MSSLPVQSAGGSALSRDNPFPGLRPYEEADSPWFFGRGRETNDLLKRLRRVRFLAVVGPSGCGKSSVVQAALLPALRDGYLDAPWRIATFRPGDRPLDNLAAAISSGEIAESSKTVRELLDSGVMGLVSALQSCKLAADTHVLILVDQFEELFQFVQRKGDEAQEETKAFLKVLLAAAASDTLPIYVVITMRLEWLNESASYVGLAEAINEGIYLLPQMSRRQFQQAILGPIEAAGGTLTTALLDRMLNDLDGRTDQLPILQHALMRMWRRRQPDAPLDIPVYKAVGEFSKCLELHADEIYAGEFVDDAGKCAVEALFRCITQVFKSRKVRRPRPLGEIADSTRLPLVALSGVVEAFRQTGRSFLVTTPGELRRESIIDISHEALMRQWTRLSQWVESEADLQSKIDRLEDTAAEWDKGNRKHPSLLYHGSSLAAAEKWKPRLKPAGTATQFLQASRKAEFRSNLLWKGSLGLAVVLILGAVGGWTFSEFRRTSEEAATATRLTEAFARQQGVEKKTDNYVKYQVEKQVEAVCSPEAAAIVQKSVSKIESQRVYVQYAGGRQADLAKTLQTALAKLNYAVPGIEDVGYKAPSQTEVRFWHTEDHPLADALGSVLRQLMTGPVASKRIENQRGVVPQGQFEVWLAPNATAVQPPPPAAEPPAKPVREVPSPRSR